MKNCDVYISLTKRRTMHLNLIGICLLIQYIVCCRFIMKRVSCVTHVVNYQTLKAETRLENDVITIVVIHYNKIDVRTIATRRRRALGCL